MANPGDFALALLRAKRAALAKRLELMTPEERLKLVEEARAEVRWPPGPWLASHAADHGAGRNPTQYAAWAQAIKNRPGVLVFAMVHIVHGNEGLAFIDVRERSLVWYHLEWQRNLSCLYIEETVDAFLASKGDLYWRMPEAELL